jgi:hypothetical protein
MRLMTESQCPNCKQRVTEPIEPLTFMLGTTSAEGGELGGPPTQYTEHSCGARIARNAERPELGWRLIHSGGGVVPICGHILKYRPETGPNGHEVYRWHVHLEEHGAAIDYLVVDLSQTQAMITGMSAEQLDAGVEAAVQRFASRQLIDNYLPVMEQVAQWPAPVILKAEDFDL